MSRFDRWFYHIMGFITGGSLVACLLLNSK